MYVSVLKRSVCVCPPLQILHWHATECETFMADESFGDSIDDVEHLITRHQEFVEGQMPVSQLCLQQVGQKALEYYQPILPVPPLPTHSLFPPLPLPNPPSLSSSHCSSTSAKSSASSLGPRSSRRLATCTCRPCRPWLWTSVPSGGEESTWPPRGSLPSKTHSPSTSIYLRCATNLCLLRRHC